jgi:hypothetical protein
MGSKNKESKFKFSERMQLGLVVAGQNQKSGSMFRNIVVFALLLLFLGCQKDESVEKKLTFEDFKDKLEIGMNYSDIIINFGDPDEDIGSGLHIYMYKLEDSSEVWIGYSNKIEYIKHVL